MVYIIVVIGLAVTIGFLIFNSIKILKPNQMGINIFLGKPGNAVDSGPHWVWYPLEKIKRYNKSIMSFKFKVSSVMTKKGKVPGYDEVIETAEIDILCTVYAYFDIKQLKRTVQNAPGNTEHQIGPELVPYVMDVVRMLGGRMPWRLINQERRAFANNVRHRLIPMPVGEVNRLDISDSDIKGVSLFKFLTPIDCPDCFEAPLTDTQLADESPFVQFGLKDVAFVIEDINFKDKDLQAAISSPEKARLEAIATRLKADAEKVKLMREGEGTAYARAEMIRIIKENPDLEALRVLQEMAQGSSNTIWFQLPQAFEGIVKQLLGGNSPSKFLNRP